MRLPSASAKRAVKAVRLQIDAIEIGKPAFSGALPVSRPAAPAGFGETIDLTRLDARPAVRPRRLSRHVDRLDEAAARRHRNPCRARAAGPHWRASRSISRKSRQYPLSLSVRSYAPSFNAPTILAEQLGKRFDNHVVIFALRQAGNSDRADAAGALHDDRETAAMGRKLGIRQAEFRLQRAFLLASVRPIA